VCESDFTFRAEPFHTLANDVAFKIVGMAPSDVDALNSTALLPRAAEYPERFNRL
jgi:translation elongation factor EF-Ts